MEDYIDVDAMYEERTHLEDEAEVGYEEWVEYNDEIAWAEEQNLAMQWEDEN